MTETYSYPGFYKYDGRKWWLNDQPIFTEINHVLLASRGYYCFYFIKWKVMNFLYIFLFVVYFYSNKIWCIEKLVLQYTIKPIYFTGMSTSQSTTHTSQH
jgi:hypothetical protein